MIQRPCVLPRSFVLNRSFVLGLIVFLALSSSAETKSKRSRSPTQTTTRREQMVLEWKEIKLLSFQKKDQACEKLKNLSWADSFPFQDIISFKKAEYCKSPPTLNTQKFQSLFDTGKYYREEFQYSKSLKYLRLAYKKAQTRDQKVDALEEQIKVFRSLQDNEGRIKSLKRLAAIDSEEYAVDYARILWTFDQTKLAQKTLQDTDRKWKKNISRQMLYYIQGRILEEKKQPIQAMSLYNKALKEDVIDEESITSVLTSLAWLNFKRGNFKNSAEQMAALVEKSSDRFAKSRAMYWQAMSLYELEEDSKAESILKTIISEDPLSYYTVLAHRELQIPFTPIKAFKGPASSLKKLNWLKPEDEEKFEWALDFEEKVFAESLLNQYTSHFFDRSDSDQRVLLENFWKAGLTNSLIKLLASSPPKERSSYFQKYLNLLFPSDFEDQIQKVASTENVDPSLVLSLIRQESGFNPMARSPTDALGLMQVMPSAARKIAQAKKIKFVKETELFDPSLNIQIGIRELKNRLDEFKGSEILAAASYNAGSNAVKGWVKTRGRPNIVEFIEEIPYEETRSYVRLVLRNQIIYKRMLEAEPFKFPETVFAAVE